MKKVKRTCLLRTVTVIDRKTFGNFMDLWKNDPFPSLHKQGNAEWVYTIPYGAPGVQNDVTVRFDPRICVGSVIEVIVTETYKKEDCDEYFSSGSGSTHSTLRIRPFEARPFHWGREIFPIEQAVAWLVRWTNDSLPAERWLHDFQPSILVDMEAALDSNDYRRLPVSRRAWRFFKRLSEGDQFIAAQKMSVKNDGEYEYGGKVLTVRGGKVILRKK